MAILKTLFFWCLEWAAGKLAALLAKWKKQKEIRDKIDEAVETHDQTPIEEAIGSDKAGAPAKHREGVRERAAKDRS